MHNLMNVDYLMNSEIQKIKKKRLVAEPTVRQKCRNSNICNSERILHTVATIITDLILGLHIYDSGRSWNFEALPR